MSDAWDDWEQADEAEIQAPVVILKPVKKPPVPATPVILQRNENTNNHDRTTADMPLGNADNENVLDKGRSLHERNRALWDKANAYEQPVIARSDNNIRTEYVPEIKILRRPKSPVTTVRVGRTQPKTLAQREADYNAAREKIFGLSLSTSSSPSPSSSALNTEPSTPTANSRSSSTSRPEHGSAADASASGSKSRSNRGSPTPSRSPSSTSLQQQGRSDMDIKPIEFKGVPIRLAQKSSLQQDTAIRQPQGPSMIPPASHASPTSSPSNVTSSRGGRGGGGAGSRAPRQQEGGSIGFRKGPFRGLSQPPAPSSSSP